MEANSINSVQFSNHGAYPTVKGQRLDGPQLTELADGLEANGLLRHDFLLTGTFNSLCSPFFPFLTFSPLLLLRARWSGVGACAALQLTL